MKTITITIPAEKVEAYDRARERWVANPCDSKALDEMHAAAHALSVHVSLQADVAREEERAA